MFWKTAVAIILTVAAAFLTKSAIATIRCSRTIQPCVSASIPTCRMHATARLPEAPR